MGVAILDAVLERLQAEFVEVGRAADYELLKPCLTASRNETDYHGLATALGVQPVSARSAVHRLRKRFKELFREQIMHTVDCEAEIDDEFAVGDCGSRILNISEGAKICRITQRVLRNP